MIISDYKALRWLTKDLTSLYHVKNFQNLVSDQLLFLHNKPPIGHLNINEHFLFFNRTNKNLSKDGYFKDISPEQLMPKYKDQAFKRRMWAKGSIIQYEPLKFNHEYTCLEHVKNVKSYRGDTFVSINRDIVDINRQVKLLTEIRTLIYTNSIPRPNNIIKHVNNTEADTVIGQFTFNEMDIIRYSQLTLNPHRIHWDKIHAVQHELYDDIIVQGPFSTQILTLFAESYIGQPIHSLNYRNLNYIYPGTTVDICLRINDTDETYQFYMRDSQKPEKVYLFLQVGSP
ncbi:similar to Saccharomyces cerevisiae YHR067W HTD2 Mitochondrial 3-hydroxyacyl-thioester dehydratase involved in fatty acid biosynthesis [Maudiozyma barnettii]|uniref:Similar to Saccharomyces cerevisiae YHR067W HTD2 Mitochondrial 3-hydroxyacyl-thioester dehydratase involved in fatty acid biosynthesis n=1 Tax=Maudiozyma barnettii TaxID=61262 RepID=A0A8H2ZHQ4_9SACH|nr:hydroxyacyl-thioester dehydratase HTD2 [Kazachstania barnettii]CAB4252354.1 similar to Saccharomyces cerevisiae YHR067W HTD2 Mitochondrial 3-hydroxyacyl-thioester dehydratase involved in fatty acid biosynthesis [Kazachstania barnettii]CAD1779088.1 similar to Saccharomyces cerevisiae YHR067W HTD2 Mitochondrial 3-hydroxyacyl-thioester dehydratase involved in fatty acid biosynthesis [Kazachstania barnettii]